MAVGWFELTTGIAGIITTWSMLAALYGKPSPWRSWAHSSYVAFALGMSVIGIFNFIYKTGYQGAMNGDLWMVAALILSVFMLLRLHPKYHYIARLPISISVGAGLGFSMRSRIFSSFLSQIKAMIIPLYVAGDWYKSLSNLVTTSITVFMLIYFLYTIEMKGAIKYPALIGEYMMYVGLGALFANQFMGRLGLLVGYFQELMTPWKIPYTLGIGLLILASIIVMDRAGILEKYSD